MMTEVVSPHEEANSGNKTMGILSSSNFLDVIDIGATRPTNPNRKHLETRLCLGSYKKNVSSK